MLKFIIFASLSCMWACSMPELLKETEHVLDDTAISLKVSQEALQRQTNVKAYVELDNGQVQTK